MEFINIKLDRIDREQKGKAEYRVNGNILFAEEAAMYHYKQSGYNVIWSENNYWWHLLGLLFWDVIFAKVKGAVKVVSGEIEEYIYTHYPEFDELFQSAININGMPDDFFTADFYRHRMDMINNRIKELSNSEIIPILHKSYKDHYGKNFRMIEDWNKFSIEELSIAPKMFSNEVLLKILERILINSTFPLGKSNMNLEK